MEHGEFVKFLAHLDIIVETGSNISLQDNKYDIYMNEVVTKVTHAMGGNLTVKEINAKIQQRLEYGNMWLEDALRVLVKLGSPALRNLDSDTRKLIEVEKERIRIERSRFNAAAGTRRSERSKRCDNIYTLSGKRDRIEKKKGRPLQKSKPKEVATMQKRPSTRKAVLKTIDIASEVEPSSTPDNSSPASSHIEQGLGKPTTSTFSKAQLFSNNEETVIADTASIFKINSAMNSSSDAQISELLREVTYQKLQREKAEQERDRYRKQWRQLQSLSDVPAEIPKVISQYMYQITRQKKRLEDLSNMEPYLKIATVQDTVGKSEQMRTQFNLLKHQVDKLLVANCAEEISLKCMCDEPSDLVQLLSTIFKLELTDTEERNLEHVPAVRLYEVIQALVGAAIHLWVFQAEFRPCSAAVSPLLQKYRDQIASLCSYEALCNFDVAAHQSLFNDDYFKNVFIPDFCRTLVGRSLNVLKRLVAENLGQRDLGDLKHRLTEIFSLAIQIRIDSLVSAERLVSIWPFTGSSFDPGEMESSKRGASNKLHLVRLPLCPGLRIFEKKKKAVVTCRGLVDHDKEDAAPTDVIKALVL